MASDYGMTFDFEAWYDAYIGLDLTRMYALFLACVGFSEKQIAKALHKSTKTIYRYIHKACIQLGARTKGEAFYIAGKQGIWDNWDPLNKDLMAAVGAGKFVKVGPKRIDGSASGGPVSYRVDK